MSVIGQPLDRVDGRLKVTGAVTFAADFVVPDLAYAVVVQSTIPQGRIQAIDASQATAAEGVVAVLTPFNAPRLPAPESRLTVLQDDKVHYNRQPIAVVVADSIHQASYAASLLHVRYDETPAHIDFKAGFPTSYPGNHNGEPGDVTWGDVGDGLARAAVKIDQVYTTPIEHHNPMEPHATLAQWDGDRLTLHDATQNISGVKKSLAKTFGLPAENVRVVCLFTGGGFGCKGQIWSHVVLAAMASRQVKRPVRLVLDRPQMFGPVGARPRTHQHLTLGATREGRLTAIRHEVHAHTSVIEDYLESSAFPTRVMYACPNVATIHRLVPLNLGTPTYMRAPGVATGTYALEVAMDELAYTLGMDPLQVRLVNYTENDPHTGQPFTSKHLRECYAQAARQFGWSKRSHAPRSMRDGRQYVGWGMATETYPAGRAPSSAKISFQADGKVLVECGSQELGGGTYTVMVQVAADAVGLSPDRVVARLGDTLYPPAPISAGSHSTASITPAIQLAATQARLKLLTMAVDDPLSPVHGLTVGQVDFVQGRIISQGGQGTSEDFTALLARHGNQPVESTAHSQVTNDVPGYAAHSFGAIFADVAVDHVGMVRVRRVVAVYDVGRVINEKTCHSQFIGGIVWGIGLALHEDTRVDMKTGRITNANLADYLVPVNADIGDIDVSALDFPDTKIDPLGARGVGEIGITGTGAAIANAVFHATGKRVRDLPITPDKLLV